MRKAVFHLPGLFEHYEFYRVFLSVFFGNREWFYEWAEIGSIYGAPKDCIFSGGRISDAENNADEVIDLLENFKISARLTFSNSVLRSEHLSDRKCNLLCEKFDKAGNMENGVIVHSDFLLNYLRNKYKNLYYVSSTTKVITDFDEFLQELRREEFRYVVSDFRLNNRFDKYDLMTQEDKDKTEFLVNECCSFGCSDRKACYENVSRKALGEDCEDHICTALDAYEGYTFSKAMKNKAFIGTEDIVKRYLPIGFSNFKIEGRSLGSAILLEFLLYYLTKPKYHLNVREKIYLDSSLDLF